ncbi:MAG: DUF2793 domain-containing protein [Burkholderiales bacterium]|nr:MAG: DUF2793 domain-containing protein [Burkholderiales bacterium]
MCHPARAERAGRPSPTGRLAINRDGACDQVTPREGWIACVRDTDRLMIHNGSSWSDLAAGLHFGYGSPARDHAGKLHHRAGVSGLRSAAIAGQSQPSRSNV